MSGDKDRLADILEGIARVEKYAASGREAFLCDELIQTWIVHNIQIIGEAAGKLSRDFRALHSEVPWPQIAGMRNIIIHDYFGIDLDQVWQVVERDLPVLRSQVESFLEDFQ
jgi:uncharacterized protein with HEPN domain